MEQAYEMEALASIFTADEFRCADIATPPFSFEVSIAINVEGVPLVLEVCAEVAAPLLSFDLPAPPRPPLRAQVTHLPPLLLRVHFPPLYPSAVPPTFQLACSWLSARALVQLAETLAGIASSDYRGEPVVFAWIELLRDAALDAAVAVSPHDRTIVCPLDPRWEQEHDCGSDGDGDVRASPLWSAESDGDGEAWLRALLAYDAREAAIAWRRAEHECAVCMDDKRGDECTRLRCGHYFCTACLTEATRVHVAHGSVERIACFECDAALSPALIRTLLTPEEAEKCERLLLSRSLDAMDDIAYCPRCTTGCLTTDDMAMCDKCSYVALRRLPASAYARSAMDDPSSHAATLAHDFSLSVCLRIIAIPLESHRSLSGTPSVSSVPRRTIRRRGACRPRRAFACFASADRRRARGAAHALSSTSSWRKSAASWRTSAAKG